MIHYLILVHIIDRKLFADYMAGHLPTITPYGGRVTFRSTDNVPVLGTETWDAVAIQEWPNEADFEAWWSSEEYRPWAQMRDKAATMTIIRCSNLAAPIPV